MSARRHDDPDYSDHNPERGILGKSLNGNIRWLVGIVLAVLTFLGGAVWADWLEIKDTARGNAMEVAIMKTQLTQIQVTLEEIKVAVKEKK